MRCLSCWSELEGPRAVYTRPCRHVFCMACADKAFSRELACPTCDTVLPKDGVVEFDVRPDASALREIGSGVFGLSPPDLCKVLRAGLDFWDEQRRNEDAHREGVARAALAERDKATVAARKTAAALEQEKMTAHSLRSEIAELQRCNADVQKKYAEKSRAARKMEERFSDLKKVHRRLQTDLNEAGHAVRDGDDGERDELAPLALEEQRNDAGERRRAADLQVKRQDTDEPMSQDVGYGRGGRFVVETSSRPNAMYGRGYRRDIHTSDEPLLGRDAPGWKDERRSKARRQERQEVTSKHLQQTVPLGECGDRQQHERPAGHQPPGRKSRRKSHASPQPVTGDDSQFRSHYFSGSGKENRAKEEPNLMRFPLHRAETKRGGTGRSGSGEDVGALSPRARVFDLNPGLRKRHRTGTDR